MILASSNTPWSTSGGFEFLNGIGATPPPLSAPTPGSIVGRSSVPPHNGGFHSAALAQHFVAPLSLPSSLPIHAQTAQGFNSNSTIAGTARNGGGTLTVSGAHLQHAPPPHLTSQHIFTSPSNILPPLSAGKAGTGSTHGTMVSMLPPSHLPTSIQLGATFMPSLSNGPPYSSALDWANVPSIVSNSVPGSQTHNSPLQGVNQIPPMMHPPPPFLSSQNSDTRNLPQIYHHHVFFLL